MKSIRELQAAATRDRILDGSERLLRSGAELTFAAVAKESQVVERTVYRYFPSADDLSKATWRRILTHFRSDAHPETEAQFHAQVREAFLRFEADSSLVRDILHSKHVQALRQIDDPGRREALEACVAAAAPGLSRADRQSVAAALRVLSSAPAWELLTDLWGFSAVRAARAVELSVRHMLAGLAATRDGRRPRRGKGVR